MMDLKLVLKLAQEFGVTQLQIFRDLMLIIQCMLKEIVISFLLGILKYKPCMKKFPIYLHLSHIHLSLIFLGHE
jgi:hypothetical protein